MNATLYGPGAPTPENPWLDTQPAPKSRPILRGNSRRRTRNSVTDTLTANPRNVGPDLSVPHHGKIGERADRFDEIVSVTRVRARAPAELDAAIDALAAAITPRPLVVGSEAVDRSFRAVKSWATAEHAGLTPDAGTATAECFRAAGLLLTGEDDAGPWEVLIALIGESFGAIDRGGRIESGTLAPAPSDALDDRKLERKWQRKHCLGNHDRWAEDWAETGVARVNDFDRLTAAWDDTPDADRITLLRDGVRRLFDDRFRSDGVVWLDTWAAHGAHADRHFLSGQRATRLALNEVCPTAVHLDRPIEIINAEIEASRERLLATPRRGRPIDDRAALVLAWTEYPPFQPRDSRGIVRDFSLEELAWISVLSLGWSAGTGADDLGIAIEREQEAVKRARSRILDRLEEPPVVANPDLFVIGFDGEPEVFRSRRSA